MIEVKNLSKSYKLKNDELAALKDISLTINNGEIYGIMGLSGAGKSTLFRCINLLEVPDSGEILIDGIDITKLSNKQLRSARKNIGMIFQNFNLLMNSTVFDNVAFPLKISHVPGKIVKENVSNLLKLVDLLDKKNVYPSQLSGGQKQRVGIARALANNPKILLSDEATSSLDPSTTESILRLLKDINQKFGITIVVITHEMNVIKKICDRVAVMDNGVIVEEGSVVDIFSNPATQISKRFLKNTVSDIIETIKIDGKNNNEKIVHAVFLGKSARKPILSTMLKKFDVDANVLAANIEVIQNRQIGNMLIKLTGSKKDIEDAVNFLSENDVKTEVLKNHDI